MPVNLLFLGQQPLLSILSPLLAEACSPESSGAHLSSRERKNQWKRQCPGASQSFACQQTLCWHSKQAQGKPPSSVCPVSSMETAHALCKRSTRAQGLHGGVGRGGQYTSTCVFHTTAGCYITGPQFKDTPSELPPVPCQKWAVKERAWG